MSQTFEGWLMFITAIKKKNTTVVLNRPPVHTHPEYLPVQTNVVFTLLQSKLK